MGLDTERRLNIHLLQWGRDLSIAEMWQALAQTKAPL